MGKNDKKKTANILLLLTGLIWGGGFVALKTALDSMPPSFIIAVRFTVAALGLCWCLFSRKKPLNRALVTGALKTGLCLYIAFILQTIGLLYTTTGKNALISTSYVVYVPFISWVITKVRPKKTMLAAVAMMFAGMALLMLKDDFTVNKGDIISLVSGIFYGLQIVFVGMYAKGQDVMQFTCLQFAFAALPAWIVALCFETIPLAYTPRMLLELGYVAVMCTLVAMTIMNIGIKYADPTHASLLMSTEAAFGCLLGVIILHETMSMRIAVGCVLTFGAILLSQIDFDVILARRGSARKPPEAL